MREMIMDKILNMWLMANHDDKLTPWGRLEVMNYVKNDLLDALEAFCPDLPTQFSAQVQSIVGHMREQIEFIFDEDVFMWFFELYKINVDTINAMMDPGHAEDGDLWKKDDEKDRIDEHANIRAKMQNYEWDFTKLYEKVKTHSIYGISLSGLKIWIQAMKSNNANNVEWMKQHMNDENKEE